MGIGRERCWWVQPQPTLQAHMRMRVPKKDCPNALKIHVVEAIRRSGEFDKDGLYVQILQEVLSVEGASDVLDEVRSMQMGIVSGTESDLLDEVRSMQMGIVSGTKSDLLDEVRSMQMGIVSGTERDIAVKKLKDLEDKIWSCFKSVSACKSSADLFNVKYLNGQGLEALATVVAFEALGLDPREFDLAVGRTAKDAAYGNRDLRLRRKWGPIIQSVLKKRCVSFEELSYKHGANKYLVYRYLCWGRWTVYEKQMARDWKLSGSWDMQKKFREFDRALGFPRSKSGPVPREFNGRN